MKCNCAKPIHQIPTDKKEIRAGKEPSDIPYHSGIMTMVRLKANKIKEPVYKHKLGTYSSCCSGKAISGRNYKNDTSQKANTMKIVPKTPIHGYLKKEQTHHRY
jgi:hypothetical protein